MDDVLARRWGWVGLRSAAALLLGAVTLFHPGVTITLLALLFGVYAIADGGFRVLSSLSNRRGRQNWSLLMLSGIAGLAAGSYVFFVPGVTIVALLRLLTAWGLVAGALEAASAARLRRLIDGEWLLAASGALTVLFGVTVAITSLDDPVAIALWLGAYGMLAGSALLVLSLRLRRWARGHGTVYG